MKFNFFNSESDRSLWIRLNAERQIEWEKSLTYWDVNEQCHKPTMQARHPRTMEMALSIAENQLRVDEESGNLRFTLEQLLSLDQEEITKLQTDHCFGPFLKVFEKL